MSRRDRPPAFQFYPGDFLSSTKVSVMTLEQVGAYVRLLCHAWLQDETGTLPDDDASLAALSGLGSAWDQHRDRVLAPFDRKAGRLVQPRMVEEREAQKKRFNQARKGALATNDKRWGSVAQRVAQRSLKVSLSGRPSVSPSSEKIEATTPNTPPTREEATPLPRPVVKGTEFQLPTNVKGSFVGVSASDLESWAALYPAVDVRQEIRKMIGWLDANPARRKTARGMKAFANRWLAKAQDRGGTSPNGEPAGMAVSEFAEPGYQFGQRRR